MTVALRPTAGAIGQPGGDALRAGQGRRLVVIARSDLGGYSKSRNRVIARALDARIDAARASGRNGGRPLWIGTRVRSSSACPERCASLPDAASVQLVGRRAFARRPLGQLALQ
ncbi:MAG: hypothetical protein NVV68_05550 [Dokdonella sp.]|nr:hypothetical protein [Dokdonella sp.]